MFLTTNTYFSYYKSEHNLKALSHKPCLTNTNLRSYKNKIIRCILARSVSHRAFQVASYQCRFKSFLGLSNNLGCRVDE
ncbi:hypothetical protein Syun_021677 [Stephania yunnanensis]|uniref:Uncharacterized protein n=1 Tax=Stephania yunnanensis TaxID=152371 RepID=A0AAP0NRA9_9MAGN